MLPLPIGYAAGHLRGILPTKVLLGIFMLVVELSFGSILHLFGYRYELARGSRRLFPFYIIAIMVVGYSACLVGPIAIFLMEQQVPEVIEMLRNVS